MRAPVPVLRRWPGARIVVVGTGPSLQPEDLLPFVHDPILVINDAYRLVPWADVIYAPDAKWWGWHGAQVAPLHGDKYALDPVVAQTYPDVGILDFYSGTTISQRAGVVATGGHSGFAAINLALHFVGPRSQIVLLGYDLAADEAGRHHFFGEHPDASHVRYDQWRLTYTTLYNQLTAIGVSIRNASRRTTITAIPHRP